MNDLMQSLMKSEWERMLCTELEVHLRKDDRAQQMPDDSEDVCGSDPQISAVKAALNRRNGFSPKSIQRESGKLPMEIPRDRHGTFEPQLIAKHQRRLAGFDEKILALYAKGMTTRDIHDIVKELYGVDVSATLVSETTADSDDIQAVETSLASDRNDV